MTSKKKKGVWYFVGNASRIPKLPSLLVLSYERLLTYLVFFMNKTRFMKEQKTKSHIMVVSSQQAKTR